MTIYDHWLYRFLTGPLNNVAWLYILLPCVFAGGIYLTVGSGAVQFRRFGYAMKNTAGKLFKKQESAHGSVTPLQAVTTALAATVGTGNIVGTSQAIAMGGYGAVFWLWIAALLGMVIKYSEVLLAVKFRERDARGDWVGGPMYYIENGLGKKYKPLAFLFAFFGVLVAFFGIGTFAQVNSIVEITRLTTSIPVEYTAIVLTILVAAITIGGLQSIARVASKIVPAMAVIYVVSTVAFLVVFADQIPAAVEQIIVSAFTPTAAAGGFLGATVLVAMRNGVARGVFSNESGLGSAPIVAAAAKTKWPAEQGLISMTGTFIDTIIICTLTGLVLVVSGAWMGDVNGAALTNAAFTMAFPTYGSIILCVGLTLFAFTTILGWNYYGERCVEYLVGVKGIMPYRIIFIALVACGAFIKLDVIWVLADIVNGLMAIPNLIALIGLSGVVVAETKKYFAHLKEEEMVVAEDSEEKVPAGH